MGAVDKCLQCYENTNGNVCKWRKMAMVVLLRIVFMIDDKDPEREMKIRRALLGIGGSLGYGYLEDWKIAQIVIRRHVDDFIATVCKIPPSQIDGALLCSLCQIYRGPIIDGS